MGEHRNSKGRIGGRTALVTGCNGFVGSYLAEFLIEEGWSVHGTLRSFRSDLKNLDQLRASGCGLELHRCDVVDYQAVADTVKAVRPDAIFHLAAQSVASDSLIPVMLSKSIQILPIDELFERNRRKNKLEVKTVHGIETEVIQLPARTQTKALGYWNGMGSWRRILQISRHRYSGHLVRLTQKWGSVTVTPNHCIYASDGGLTTPLTNPEMLAIRRVNYHAKESDMMRLKSPQFSPRGGFIVNSDNPESPCSVKQVLRGRDLLDFMKFVGAYVSEGCVHYRQNGKADVIISNGDLKWIHAVQGCLKTFFTGRSWIVENRKGRYKAVYNLGMSSVVLANILEALCGRGSLNKKLPFEIFKFSPKVQDACLDFLYFGDGSVESYQQFENKRYTTTSRLLAAQLCLLLSMKKIDYTFDRRTPSRGNTRYDVREVKTYNSSLGFRRQEKIKYEGYVYDLGIEGTSNFSLGDGNIVVHNSFVPDSWASPQQTMTINVNGTLNVLEAVRRHAPDAVVQVAGTSEEYGLVKPEECPIGEEHALRPLSPYGVSKCAADLLTRQYAASYHMRAVVTRAFNHSRGRRGHLFAESAWARQIALAEAAGGGEVTHGNLDAVRDYTDAGDIVRGYVLAVQKGKPGEAYVLASGTGWRMGDVLDELISLARVHITKRVDTRLMRPSDVPRLIGNAAKAKQELGWRPEIPMRKMLRDLLCYWRAEIGAGKAEKVA